VLRSDPAKAKPGLQGNLIIDISGEKHRPPPLEDLQARVNVYRKEPCRRCPSKSRKVRRKQPCIDQETSPVPRGAEIVLRSDPAKAKPGLQGNLIIDISGERTPPASKGRPAASRQRVALGTLPAIPFEIAKSATEAAVH
jgi:hypothetical protein